MDYGEAERLDQATVVTVGELRPAIIRVLTEQLEEFNDPAADVIATDIIRDIMNSREPVWESGDVVRDADDVVWLRLTRSQWQQPGSSGSFPHLRPKRPLRLLDSPAARKRERRDHAALERARDDGAPI